MLTIKPVKSAAGAVKYLRDHLVRNDIRVDYYANQHGEIKPEWMGRGPKLLGLSGEVQTADIEAVLNNRHPQTGEQLTGRKAANAVPAYEVTTDLPKWATLASEIGGDSRIMEVDRYAWEKTFRAMEDDSTARVRVDGADYNRPTGNMMCAPYEHSDTRQMNDGKSDPHRHRHALLANKTFDVFEGKWKALQMKEICRNAPFYQALYHSYQAKGWADAGYAIERDRQGFQLVGVDKALVDKFSRRTAVIEAEALKRNITDPKVKAGLGKLTRNTKRKGASLEDRREEWKSRCTPEELAFLETASNRGVAGNRASAKESVEYAIEDQFYKHAVVSEKRLYAEALMHGVGSVTLEDIRPEMQKRTDLIYEVKDGQRYVTTVEWRDAEKNVVNYVREGRGKCAMLGGPEYQLPDNLDAHQTAAAGIMLTSRDRVIPLTGAAGAGKTYVMQSVRDVIEANRKKVYAFAPSTQASRVNQRASGFPEAETVAKLLTDENLQRKVNGQVIWVDEAGMLSVKDMNRVFKIAEEQNARVIISGDTKQIGPINGPSALKLIREESGVRFAELLKSRRQTEKAYLASVEDLRKGNEITPDGKMTYLERGVKRLDEKGWINELPAEEMYHNAAQDYLDAVGEIGRDGNPKSAVLVTLTHAEADALTGEIRAGLRDTGAIKGRDFQVERLNYLDWSPPQKAAAVSYQPGLVVQFDQNAKGIKRGERFKIVGREGKTVKAARSNGSVIELPLQDPERFSVYREDSTVIAKGDLIRPTKNGQTKHRKSKVNNGDIYKVAEVTKDEIVCDNGFVLPRNYGHLRTGYTLTADSSQSKTVDRSFACLSEKSLTAANLKKAYVTLSRGKESAMVYTDNKEAMLEAISRDKEPESATELLRNQHSMAQEARKIHLDQVAAKHRIRRVYEAMRDRGRQLYQQWKERGHGYAR